MLKLEKIRSTQEVSIIIADKAPLLTRPLLIAFAVAASIHLLFLLLFHIAPLKFRWSDKLYPPIAVEANTGPLDNNFSVDLGQEPLLSTGLPPPPKSTPTLHPLPSQLSIVHSQSDLTKDNPYETTELSLLTSYRPAAKPSHPNTIEVFLSGPLAQSYSVGEATKKALQELQKVFSVNGEMRTLYDLKVDPKSGKIIWISRIESTGYSPLDRKLEQIVKNLSLSRLDSENVLEDGTVEIQFFLSEKSK